MHKRRRTVVVVGEGREGISGGFNKSNPLAHVYTMSKSYHLKTWAHTHTLISVFANPFLFW